MALSTFAPAEIKPSVDRFTKTSRLSCDGRFLNEVSPTDRAAAIWLRFDFPAAAEPILWFDDLPRSLELKFLVFCLNRPSRECRLVSVLSTFELGELWLLLEPTVFLLRAGLCNGSFTPLDESRIFGALSTDLILWQDEPKPECRVDRFVLMSKPSADARFWNALSTPTALRLCVDLEVTNELWQFFNFPVPVELRLKRREDLVFNKTSRPCSEGRRRSIAHSNPFPTGLVLWIEELKLERWEDLANKPSCEAVVAEFKLSCWVNLTTPSRLAWEAEARALRLARWEVRPRGDNPLLTSCKGCFFSRLLGVFSTFSTPETTEVILRFEGLRLRLDPSRLSWKGCDFTLLLSAFSILVPTGLRLRLDLPERPGLKLRCLLKTSFSPAFEGCFEPVLSATPDPKELKLLEFCLSKSWSEAILCVDRFIKSSRRDLEDLDCFSRGLWSRLPLSKNWLIRYSCALLRSSMAFGFLAEGAIDAAGTTKLSPSRKR